MWIMLFWMNPEFFERRYEINSELTQKNLLTYCKTNTQLPHLCSEMNFNFENTRTLVLNGGPYL